MRPRISLAGVNYRRFLIALMALCGFLSTSEDFKAMVSRGVFLSVAAIGAVAFALRQFDDQSVTHSQTNDEPVSVVAAETIPTKEVEGETNS